MKYRKYIVALAVSALVLGGCSSKVDAEFDTLVEQANRHYNNEEYVSAVAVFAKALEVKEDAEIRTKLNKINEEKKRIDEAVALHDELKSTAAKYENVMSEQDILDICDTYFDLFAKIESFDVSSRDGAAKYIESLRESSDFLSAKVEAGTVQSYYLVKKAKDNPYTDAKGISDKITNLLNAYPLPEGFSS
jgi:D-ribose pyranose/furanose isomerase RbsD